MLFVLLTSPSPSLSSPSPSPAVNSGSKQNAVPSTVASSQPGTPHLNKETKMDAIADSTPMSPEESELQDKPTTTTFNVFQPALEESSHSSS